MNPSVNVRHLGVKKITAPENTFCCLVQSAAVIYGVGIMLNIILDLLWERSVIYGHFICFFTTYKSGNPKLIPITWQLL